MKIQTILIFKHQHKAAKPIRYSITRQDTNPIDYRMSLLKRDDWVSKGNCVMNPRSFYVMVLKTIETLFNNVWWIVFTLRLAFGPSSDKLIHLNRLEHFLDAAFLVEIILTFFIGIPIDEVSKQANQVLDSKRSYNYNMKEIAQKYLNSTLIFDLLSLYPKIFPWGSNLYFLKAIRILH